MKTILKSALLIILASCSLLFSEVNNILPSSLNCLCFTKSPNLELSMELLVFQPKIEGIELALINILPDRELAAAYSTIQLKWASGGRVGLAYLLDYDSWKLTLNGSLFILGQSNEATETQHGESVVTSPGGYGPGTVNGKGLMPLWSHPRAYDENANNIRYSDEFGKWTLHFYTIDLGMSKNFCVSKKISIAPSFGLSDVFFYQDLFVHYSNGTPFSLSGGGSMTPHFSDSTNKQDTFGVGPKVGVNTKWYFLKNTNIFANVTGALLYTFCYSKRHDLYKFESTVSGLQTEEMKMKKHFSSLKPAIDLALGINFEKCLDSFFMRFSVAYEAEFYWKFNNFLRFADDVNYLLTYTPKGDFQLHGVVIGLDLLF